MAMLVELNGARPTIGADVFLAPTAVLVGDVRVGDRATIWFGAVLRGDLAHIEVGAETSIQDNAVLHCARELPTIVGRGVTVGHSALLEGCVIEDDALIGMGAIVLQHARVGSNATVAAGSVVREHQRVAPEMLAAGVPAVDKRPLTEDGVVWNRTAAAHYQELRELYVTTSREETPWSRC